jgi:putative FmdB family regulatory protein
MPTYDYQCPECKETHVMIHGFDDVINRKCAKCKVPLRKKFASVPTSFKGEGFYTTDKFTDR